MLQLTYDLTTDPNGVIDGRELAALLFEDAYKLILPYADACPGRAWQVFAVIAASVIQRLEREEASGILLTTHVEGQENAEESKRLHLELARTSTSALLEKNDCRH